MKFSWHGHSVVLLETMNQEKILIDPFINGNEACDLDPETIKVDYIVLTHAHNDHVGEAVQISKANNAPIIAMVELANFLETTFGVETHPLNIGGTAHFTFGSVKMTPAIHSSSYDYEGVNYPLGLAAGVIISDGTSKVYHAGDTSLFSDMNLIGPVDVAFLPIGDNYTMGIKDAVVAAKLVQAKLVVPVHYNTFPIIEQNPYDFINRLEEANGLVLEVGEVTEL